MAASSSFKLTTGSRVQVWHGTARKTSGGLTKSDLKYNNKTGRIVSVKASRRAMSSSNPLRQRGLLGAIGLLDGYVAKRGGARRTPLPGKGKMARMAHHSMAHMSARKKKVKSPKRKMSASRRMSPMMALRRSMRMMA